MGKCVRAELRTQAVGFTRHALGYQNVSFRRLATTLDKIDSELSLNWTLSTTSLEARRYAIRLITVAFLVCYQDYATTLKKIARFAVEKIASINDS